MASEPGSGPTRPLCRLVLVESTPQDLQFAAGSPSAQPLAQAWMQLLDMAQESVHVASYYWSLTGSDIGVNDSSSHLVCASPTPLPPPLQVAPCRLTASWQHIRLTLSCGQSGWPLGKAGSFLVEGMEGWPGLGTQGWVRRGRPFCRSCSSSWTGTSPWLWPLATRRWPGTLLTCRSWLPEVGACPVISVPGPAWLTAGAVERDPAAGLLWGGRETPCTSPGPREAGV